MNLATGIYFDGQVARGRTVAIEFTPHSTLRLSGEGLAQEIELARIRVSDRLGDVPRFIYLPDDAVIETPDNAIVDAALGERQQGRGSRLIHLLESQQRIAAVGCVLLLAAVAALGLYGPPMLARAVAARVSPEVDQRIGAAALVTIRPYFGDSKLNREERSRVQQQLDRLTQANPTGPHPRIEFRSMNGGLPNAFALPGNIIIVTDELVRLPAHDDEIAAVLAHELGHLEKRHGLQSLLRGSFALLIVASVTGDLSAMTSFAGTIPLTILTAGYSRELESEADHYALDLLRLRGFKPHAFTTVLVKLEAARASLQKTSTYLSTHPATEERTALFGSISAEEKKGVLAEPWVDQAKSAMSRNDPAAAVTAYTHAIELNPTALTYTLRAKARQARNDFADADGDLKRALEIDPKSVDAYAVRVEVLALGLKKYDDAIATARKALALSPKNAPITATLGFSELMKGDAGAAADDLDEAIALARTDFHGWAYRGFLNQRQNNTESAMSDYNIALTLAPKTQWICYSRGVLRNRQKDYAGALADFAVVTEPSRLTEEFYYERGLAEQSTGKTALAIADYSRAFDKSGSKAALGRVHLNRGIAYATSAQYDLAITDFDAVIELEPKNGTAYFQRARTRRLMGNAPTALRDLDQAAKAGVGAQFIARERAELDWDLGRDDDAIRECDGILKQGPDAHVYQLRGLLEFSRGNWAKADADLNSYQSMVKSRSKDYTEFFRLLNRRRQKVIDQQANFETTIAAWPDSWAKWIGWYLAGQTTETGLVAESNTSGTPTRNQRLCEAYYYIGMTHLIAGEEAQAEDFFQKCLRTGATSYYEYKLARTELARLRQGNGRRG